MDTRSQPQSEAPLRGVSVLITRAADDVAPFRARLEELGSTVLELPTIDFAPPLDWEKLDDALRNLARYHWIAFTSRNAVRAVFQRLADLNLERDLPEFVAAVGPSTAAELASHGIAVRCEPRDATAAALVTAMTEAGVDGKRVLIPHGDLARPELATGLRVAGAQVDEVSAYRTIQPLEARGAALDALRRGGVDVVALASPSSLRNLVTMLGVQVTCLQYVKLVCIGPTTAAAVRDLRLEPAAIADEHTLDGLVRAIVGLWDLDQTHDK